MINCMFFDNIECPDIYMYIIKFFDELMILYNIIGIRKDVKISTIENETIAKFNIVFPTINEANRLYNSFNGLEYKVYSKLYKINIDIIDELTLHITLVEV